MTFFDSPNNMFHAIFGFMEVQTYKTALQVCISLKGRLDGSTAQELESEARRVVDSETKELQFSCADLDYVSSAGVALFIKMGKEITARGGQISFSGVRGEVRKVFELSGLATVFHVKEGRLDESGLDSRKAFTKAERAERLFLPARLDSLQFFQDFIRSYARRSDVDPAIYTTIDLIVEEIIVNIVKHAYREGPGDIDVACDHDDEHLYLEFQDSGPAFNPLSLEAPDLDANIAERKIGGLGIHLVRKVSAGVQYERRNERNILRVSVARCAP